MPHFSVVIFTAPPPGQSSEAAGPMIRIDGKETVLRCVELFANRPEVKQVIVVFADGEAEEARRKFGPHFAFTGVKLVVAPPNGPRWLDQLAAAREKLDPATTHVIVHDGARPAVPYTDLDCIFEETAKARTSVGLTTPVRAMLVELNPHGTGVAYHHPQGFAQLLTPFGYTRAEFDRVATTKQETPATDITLVKGSPLNIRVGGPGDESLVKTMLAMLPKQIKPSEGPFSEAKW